MSARLLCVFPGCGKSTVYRNAEKYGFYPMETKPGLISHAPISISIKGQKPLFDSDSSLFDKTQFPTNYIEHITRNSLALAHANPVFFISSHDNVRAALKEAGLGYELVYPDKSLKDIWIERYKERGSSEFFIKLLTDKWDDFIDSCINDTNATKHYVLKENQGMWDLVTGKL